MDALLSARQLLENTTPLKTDCGLLCDHACCKSDDDVGGEVWLLPGEEAFACPWANVHESTMPLTRRTVLSVSCASFCDRSMRPFFCRIFPLVPYFSAKRGAWDVRMDRRAWMVCPLCSYGVKGLNSEFVSAAREAVKILAEDKEMEAFLRDVSAEENAYRMSL